MRNGLRNLCYAVWTVLGLVLIAHQFGRTAGAQSGALQIVGFANSPGTYHAITVDGDIYRRAFSSASIGPLEYLGNFWSGAGPIAATPSTWSQIKAGR